MQVVSTGFEGYTRRCERKMKVTLVRCTDKFPTSWEDVVSLHQGFLSLLSLLLILLNDQISPSYLRTSVEIRNYRGNTATTLYNT